MSVEWIGGVPLYSVTIVGVILAVRDVCKFEVVGEGS